MAGLPAVDKRKSMQTSFIEGSIEMRLWIHADLIALTRAQSVGLSKPPAHAQIFKTGFVGGEIMFLAEFHRLRRLAAEGITLGLLRRGEADMAFTK